MAENCADRQKMSGLQGCGGFEMVTLEKKNDRQNVLPTMQFVRCKAILDGQSFN